MKAEKYLEQIKAIEIKISNRVREYERWKSIAEGLGNFSSGERVSSSKNLHSGEEAICRYIDLEREIKRLTEQKNGIVYTIEKLPPDECKILCMIYAEERTLKEVAYDFNRSYEWAKKTKRKALEHLQEILDEKRG